MIVYCFRYHCVRMILGIYRFDDEYSPVGKIAQKKTV